MFTIYEYGSHLGHVTSIILMNFYFLVPTSLILAENGPVVTEKQLEFLYVNDLGPRSKNDTDLQYPHILINTIIFRSQAAKNPRFSTEKPKLQNLTLP